MDEQLETNKKELEKNLRKINSNEDFIQGALYGFDKGVEFEQMRKREWKVFEIKR